MGPCFFLNLPIEYLKFHSLEWWNGRHSGLKIPRPQGHAGSSPASSKKFHFLSMKNDPVDRF